MRARKLFATAMIVSMLLVAFNVGFSDKVKAEFMEQVPTNGLSPDFYPQDVKWDHTGTMAVVVGYDMMGGPNAYAYFSTNDTWVPIDGYYPGQELYSVDYYNEGGTGNGTEPPGPPEVLLVDANGYTDGQTEVIQWAVENASCSPIVTRWDVFGTDGPIEGHPSSTDMAPYDIVVWVCSYNMWAPTGDCFSGPDEMNVAGYLEGGGAFFMANAVVTSYFSYGGGTQYDFVGGDFAYDYLGMDGVSVPTFNNEWYVEEYSGDSVYNGLGQCYFDWNKYSWNPPGTPPSQCDGLDPIADPNALWCIEIHDTGAGYDYGGIRYNPGPFRTVFMGFPLEPLGITQRDDIIGRTINWLAPSVGVAGSVLVVDADYYEWGLSSYYMWSLLNNSVDVTFWDVWDAGFVDQDKPSETDMAPYDLVVWVPSYNMDGNGGPGSAFDMFDEAEVQNYLDGGGNFFLSSTSWTGYTSGGGGGPWSSGDFVFDYMALSEAWDDSQYDDAVHGISGDPAFDGFGPAYLDWNRAGWGGPPTAVPLYVDEISEAHVGVNCMEIMYDLPPLISRNGGAKENGGIWKTMFMSFPFETLAQPEADDFWDRALGWFGVTGTGSGSQNPLGPGSGNEVMVTTLDQSNENFNTTVFFDVGMDTGDPWAQSFLPSLDHIAKVEFYIYAESTSPDYFHIEICPDSGGIPSASNITHGWIQPAQIPIYPSMNWVECWFEGGGASITPGTTYWIKCDRRGYSSIQGWLADLDMSYGPGVAIEDIPPWSGELAYDWIFRTYGNVSGSGSSAALYAGKDNTIYDFDWYNSNGAGNRVFAGNDDMGYSTRGLMYFDIAGNIPNGATITDVHLRLYCEYTMGGTQVVRLNRVTHDWGEGNSVASGEELYGTTAQTDDATWEYRFADGAGGGTPWNNTGGDFSGFSSASTSVSTVDTYYTWSSSMMIDDVQSWLDNPSMNFGWLLLGNEVSTYTAMGFSSRTNPNAFRRPMLTILYNPPTSPENETIGIGTFWMCGNAPGGMPATGSTVYKLEPSKNLTLQKVSTYPKYGMHYEFSALALDDLGNPLVVGDFQPWWFYYNGTDWCQYGAAGVGNYCFFGVDYNPNDKRFYAVGYDMSSQGACWYSEPSPLYEGFLCYPDLSTFPANHDEFNSIAWNHLYNYGMVVGVGGVYIVDPIENSTSLNWLAKEEYNINSYYDCDWDTDGWNEAGMVGTNNSGDACYWRYYHTNPHVLYGHSITPPSEFHCCAFKPPSSPKWLFIPYNGGGWRANILENDQSSEIILNAGFPHIFNVDMWLRSDMFRTSVLNTQVDPDTTYTFYIQGNYSYDSVDHWNDVGLRLTSWYDDGWPGSMSNPGDPTWSAEDYRTQQFNITHLANAGSTSMNYPAGFPGEFAIHSTYADPSTYGPDGSWHRLYINVTFGAQTRMANSAFPNGPPSSANYWDKNFALNDPWSWDLDFTLYDVFSPGARNITYEEYGIKEAVSVSVTGNPNGAAPPGTANYPLSNPSNVTYSSNVDYWVNISIPHLYKDGDIMSPYWIPAGNVMVQNTHPSATVTNSDMSGLTSIPGPNLDICVWGTSAPSPMTPVFNGTQSAGPSSDFIYFWYGVPDYTNVFWWVTIPPGQAEGLYRATITFRIESF
jgi:hypothetical protein